MELRLRLIVILELNSLFFLSLSQACLMGCPGPSQELFDLVKNLVMDRSFCGNLKEAIGKNQSRSD